MVNLKIICVGKIKEKFMQDTLNEYIKKLSRFAKLEIIELADEKIKENASFADEEKVREIESNKILNVLDKIGKTSVFLCDLNGKEYTSVEFSKSIENTLMENSTITFIIGGSLGTSKILKDKIQNKICFSKMTFPHQLFRIFLTEQIYRAFKIINNETYHK